MKRIALSAATLGVAALTALAAPAAHAQTFYTTLSAFNAAATTTAATTYDFNGIAPPGGETSNPAVLVTPAPGRVTFSVTGGNDPNVYAASSTSTFGIFTLSDGTDSVIAGLPDGSASTTTIALGGSYTAFAIEYGMDSNVVNSFTFALFNGATQVGTASNEPALGGDRFFGATSDTAFSSVKVTAASGVAAYVVFDNARVGSAGAAVVPEAGSFALLLPALGVLGVVVRRKVRAA